MPERYFTKFPTMVYSNTAAVDITRRVTIGNVLNPSPFFYEEYALKDALRPDLVSNDYYEDPYYEWLLYLTNGVIDPYYGWYVSEEDFESYIISKYGSIENAQRKIIHYRVNWPTDSEEIPVSFYEQTLDLNYRKYYTPIFTVTGDVVFYVRNPDNSLMNTNKLLNFNINITSGNTFSVGEIVDIENPTMSAVVGKAEIVFANSSVLKVKNISGNTSATNIAVGYESNTIATITQSNILATNITDEEASYWEPVSFYDYEQEKNEANRNINLYRYEYALDAAETLRTKLRE